MLDWDKRDREYNQMCTEFTSLTRELYEIHQQLDELENPTIKKLRERESKVLLRMDELKNLVPEIKDFFFRFDRRDC